MAKVETSQGTMVGKAPVMNNKQAPPVSERKSTYCILCRHWLFKDEEQEHIHSMLHHRELDTALGTRSFHNCQACKASSMGLQEYAQHISTAEHKSNLKTLICKKLKPIRVECQLSQEDLNQLLKRNKILKNKQRKLKRRIAKQMKQETAIKTCKTVVQEVTQQNKVASDLLKQDKTKQENTTRIKQGTHLKGSNNVVVKNKENKVSTLQKHPHQRVTARPPDVAAEPPRHQTSVRDHFTVPIRQMRYGADVSVNSVAMEQSHTERPQQSPHNTEEGLGLHKIKLPVISKCDSYSKQYDNAVNFTSDNITGCGGFIFDDVQRERPGSIEPVQKDSHRSAPPAPANTTVSATPIQVVDVSSMLRQIRRELGVREPCRADREAKKQQSEVSARPADHSSSQKAVREKRQPSGGATTSVRAPRVNSCSPAARSKGHRSSVAPAKTKQVTSQEATQRLGAACAPSNRSTLSGKPTFTKPNPSSSHRVQTTHEANKSYGKKETRLKPTLTNLLTLSGAKRRLSVRDMYSEMQKRKRDKAKGMPRFGITFSKPPPDQETSTQPQEDDSQLSEGFHWETIQDSPSLSDLTLPVPLKELTFSAASAPAPAPASASAPAPAPAPASASAPASAPAPAHAASAPASAPAPAPAPASAPASAPAPAPAPAHAASAPAASAPAASTSAAATAAPDSHSEMRSSSRLQVPGAAQQCGTNLTALAVPVKTEPNLEEENEGLRDNNSLKKRKHNMIDGSVDKELGGKKKTAERKQSSKDHAQLDQLLAVSQRENELSHSLQDLDKSLIQARNTLQAAYTEVQRLLLLKQQFSIEVDSLRAQRIEILQGIQEVYSGSSNVAEKTATTTTPPSSSSSSTGQYALPSSHAFTQSSSQQTPASTMASSITQPLQTPPLLPVTSIKQETCHPPTARQASQFASSSTNAPWVSSAGPAPAATATATASVSTSTLSPPLSSSEQEHKTKQELKDSVKTGSLIEEKVHQAKSDSKEELRGNIQEKGKGRESATEKRVPERDHKAVALDDKNESDDSVEVVETSNQVIINIDESDGEHSPDTVPNAPVPPEPPQRSVSAELSSASKLTSQQSDADRKVQPVKDASAAVECVEDEEPSLGAFSNHNGPIYGLQVHEGMLYTCSGDNTARAYSLRSRECQAVFEGHTNKVNCLLVSTPPNMPARLYTGSSDETIRCYSLKSKKCLEQISLPDRVFCLHIAWNILYVGLANGSVASYDLKTLKQLDVVDCHGPRAVSCLGSSQEGARRVLLVGSYDSTISIRDAKSGLLLRSLQGHSKTVLCIKVVNDLVFSSSSDTAVHAHNIHTGELIRVYKGHSQAITSIVIFGQVMVTASLDQLIRVYDLQSHDRLQVYAGYSDMVMCLAVHKSVIYSGCYDGSIQAVKLNLTKNHRCWWQNCSLIFGIAEHLVQHLVGDHTHPNLEAVRCRWRGCDAFFNTQQAVQQKLPEHMQNHVENDSKVEG